jgi:histidine triad (HIT) family protein
MSSIFTKIVNGEIPCYKIAEDDNYLAFFGCQIQRSYVVHSKFEIDKIFLIWTKHTIWIDAFCKKVAIA